MSDVIYLYGFVPATAPAPADPLPGIEGVAVELIAVEQLQAVLSPLPADEYSPALIDARLQELGWVAQHGLEHERVVAWFVDHAEIIPAPLFTLYSSRAALVSAARERAADVAAQLERLAGRREWDLKISYDRARLEQHAGAVSPEVRALDEEIAAASPGKRFLLERKRTDLVKRDIARAAHEVAAALFDELRPHAEEHVALAPPRDAAELPVLVAAALLLTRERENELRTLVQQRATALERLGFTVELTGPWAAYRFLAAHAASA